MINILSSQTLSKQFLRYIDNFLSGKNVRKADAHRPSGLSGMVLLVVDGFVDGLVCREVVTDLDLWSPHMDWMFFFVGTGCYLKSKRRSSCLGSSYRTDPVWDYTSSSATYCPLLVIVCAVDASMVLLIPLLLVGPH